MIKPTNGRMVWVIQQGLEQPLAATIAFVHSDELINVCAYTAEGVPQPLQGIPLSQDAPGDPATWPPILTAVWMPYQKGQAAKTEALEAQLGTVGSGG